jgi:hypothetical protein
MIEFFVGNRVRVRPLPVGGAHAGRGGIVVWVARCFTSGPAVFYQVHLDDDPAHFAPGNHFVFGPEDLEPEAGDWHGPQCPRSVSSIRGVGAVAPVWSVRRTRSDWTKKKESCS